MSASAARQVGARGAEKAAATASKGSAMASWPSISYVMDYRLHRVQFVAHVMQTFPSLTVSIKSRHYVRFFIRCVRNDECHRTV